LDQQSRRHSWPLWLAAALLTLLGLLPVANWLTGGRAIPWWGAAVREWSTVGLGVVLLAVVLARAFGDRLDAVHERVTRLVLGSTPRAFLLATASLAFVLSAAASIYCFARQPHLIDEMAQLWHARILLAGRLALPTDPNPEFFSALHVIDAGGKWYSHFPVGGPAILALGMLAGAVWLVNPLLIALCVACVYRFARITYGDATARVAAVLVALSPFVVFMGGTQMNHVPALALTWLALAATAEWRESGTPVRSRRCAMVIGASIGALIAIRPLDGAIVGAVVGVFQLPTLLRQRRWSGLAVQLAAAAVPVALLLWSNALTTGHPLRMGYEVMWGADEGLGFRQGATGETHTPRRALVLASANLMRVNLYLFEWPIPALLLAVVTLVLVRRVSRWDGLLLSLVGAIVGAYALYWHEGFHLGPRYLFIAMPAVVILVARAPGLMAERLSGTARRAVALVLPLCVAASLLWPAGVSGALLRARQYHSSLWILKVDLERQVAESSLDRALVFVHEGWGARLMARLWALGVPRTQAEQVLRGSDACALEHWLRGEEARPAADSAGRLGRLAALSTGWTMVRPRPDRTPDSSLRFADDAPFTGECAAELAADEAGVSLYPPFLRLNRPAASGRVDGSVIFVRDLGAHNEVLRERFGDRGWYRYAPRRGPGDHSPAFVPYR
jgi:hypothetical protein